MQAQVIDQMPFGDYAAIPETHATLLRHILTSPRHYKHRRDSESSETDAMRRGRAAHTAVFEPDNFLRHYALWEGGTRRGKEWDAFAEKNAEKTILTVAEYETALRIRDSVRSHPVAGKYLREPGKAEVTIRWVHERTGIKVKCRLDWVCSVHPDLKTSKDISPWAFASTAVRLGYFFQAAIYHDALKATGQEVPGVIIAVESAEPHDTIVYQLTDDELAYGRREYERALDILAYCLKTNEWPGRASDTALPLTVPKWAKGADEPGPAVNDDDIPF